MNPGDSASSRVAEGGPTVSGGPNGTTVVEIASTAESVADLVVQAVAHRSGRDPLELPPLQRTIDCEALDGLFGFQPGSTREVPEDLAVQFDYAGHTVTLANRQVVVTDADGV